jgi:hypothetical protein
MHSALKLLASEKPRAALRPVHSTDTVSIIVKTHMSAHVYGCLYPVMLRLLPTSRFWKESRKNSSIYLALFTCSPFTSPTALCLRSLHRCSV